MPNIRIGLPGHLLGQQTGLDEARRRGRSAQAAPERQDQTMGGNGNDDGQAKPLEAGIAHAGHRRATLPRPRRPATEEGLSVFKEDS